MKYLIRAESLDAHTSYAEWLRVRNYERFCAKRKAIAFPAERAVLCAFLDSLCAQSSWEVIKKYCNAIRRRHQDCGWSDPLVTTEMLAALRIIRKRALCVRTIRKRSPRKLARILDSLRGSSVSCLRDTVVFLLMYCARMSAKALCELNRNDIRFSQSGMRVYVRHGQHRRWNTIKAYYDTRYCPVAAMRRYLRALDDDEPALFRRVVSGRGMVPKLTLSRARAPALTTALNRRYRASGNPKGCSLRELHASMIALAFARGASDDQVMRQMGFADMRPVYDWKMRLGINSCDASDRLGL